jgi:Family of unknown function (DUF5670)
VRTAGNTLHSGHALTETTDGISSVDPFKLGGSGSTGGLMLAIIGVVLLVMWLLGFIAFHVTSGVIHLLLILAVVSVIAHFFRGRAAV